MVSAQQFTVSGVVQDAETGEPLIGSYVFDVMNKVGTTTNSYGFYSLSVGRDSAQLQVSYLGYTPFMEVLFLNRHRPKRLNINLAPAVGELAEATVVADRMGAIQERIQMSSVSLDVKKVKDLPVFLGETDILKAIQLLPGVQSGTEGTSGFYVRGGGPDQNLILIDGVPVYNVSHLFGFFSIFNADAINHVQLIKGGFPAEYGGRLSSVLDIRMKEGNNQEWHGEGSVGNISAKLTIEGPIVKGKTSMLLSARRTYLDVLMQPFMQDDLGTGGYYFQDFNAKINHKIDDRNKLYLSYYGGDDLAYMRYKESYDWDGVRYNTSIDNKLGWGNQIATFRWNSIVTPKLFSNVTATYSKYDFNTLLNLEQTTTYVDTSLFSSMNISYLSGIEDVGAKWDMEYHPNSQHEIKFGINVTNHRFTPGVNSWTFDVGGFQLDTAFGSYIQDAMDVSAYFQDDWKIGDKLRVNMGLHMNQFSVNQEDYISLQPRLSARYLINEMSSIKASYVQMNQNLHLLANQGLGLPTDLWVPATDRIRPQVAEQVAVGYANNLGKGWELSLEGYYKEMDNLIEYKDGVSFMLDVGDWQDKVTVGRGWSYGAEFLLEKKQGRTTGWLGYTWAKAMRQFDDVNFGEPYPYTFDRRHDVSIVLNHKLSENWKFGFVWVYGTGRAVTLPTQQYLTDPSLLDNYWYQTTNYIGSRNNFREPAYHRADFAFTRTKETKWGERSWQFGVYNAYNRINVFYMDFGYSNQFDEYGLIGYGLFPIIPSISYQFKF